MLRTLYFIQKSFYPISINCGCRLMGRAKVEMTIASLKGFQDDDGKKFDTAKLVFEVDGYHAPLTSGSLVDLVQKKFFDGM